MRKMTIDGNEACSMTSYLFTEVAGIYPITPSSTMAEHVDEWSSKKKNIFDSNVKVVEMQSEAGASGFIHGALTSGTLATTYTASQGLLLMIPNMYKMAGEMLPCVIHVAARSLSTHALSIFGDHQDIYACRATGFCMLASSSVQDAAYLSGIAHLSSIEASLPFMHFFDGFRTSHEINKIDVLDDDEWKSLVNFDAIKRFRDRALSLNNPKVRGMNVNDDIYFQMTEARNKDYLNVPDIVNSYMGKLNNIAHTNYKPFNYYGSKTAKNIIIAMGSVCETIKEVIDQRNDVGLIEVHLYRPFSKDYLIKEIPLTVENIAVLDRTKEAGSIGEPLYLDVVSALKDKNYNIVGGRYGLSSKNTTPSQIDAVYNMLNGHLVNNFTIGIDDDVTNTSLQPTDLKIQNHKEFLIYGYGSDGMVSASKSIMKIVGNNTSMDVQGYFQYDSKKSGGVTIGHLRFSDKEIKSTYYVENPELVVLTKDTYFEQFDMLDNIKENGIFLICSDRTKEELINIIPKKTIDIIKNKNIKLYISRANKLALKHNLRDKISMIVESQIMYLSNLIDYESFLNYQSDAIKKQFIKKGSEVINQNIDAIKEASDYLENLDINTNTNLELNVDNNLYSMINARRGNDLKVSDFIEYRDGTYTSETSKYDKRMISNTVPNWIKENCINCNQCSMVCPHSVIRPYLLTEEEYNNAPDMIKNRCIKMLNPMYKDYYFTIAISVKDCTGCGLCIKTCPGKQTLKALDYQNINDALNNKEQEIFDYLNKNIKEKNTDDSNIIGCAFKKPHFEFSGACAGCGETSYIRILTQLFGSHMMIANATGCSSIYGASIPSIPYSIPWASSLFEDNAEFGYGIKMSDIVKKEEIKNIMMNIDEDFAHTWLDNMNNYEITKQVYDSIDYNKYPKLNELKDFIVKRSNWIIGGDGWAYDIGFSGIDHVLASNQDINILILNTEVYSNTGGQTSKATNEGAVAPFASTGKKTVSKDLAKIAMTYSNTYVAQINLGANMMQTIKALKEAEKHDGPSIIIAYAPCINHGIDGGMVNSLHVASLATKSGYYPIFRYDSNKFILDSKNVDFDTYKDFLMTQNRFKQLSKVNPNDADKLIEEAKEKAIKNYKYYENLEKETSIN